MNKHKQLFFVGAIAAVILAGNVSAQIAKPDSSLHLYRNAQNTLDTSHLAIYSYDNNGNVLEEIHKYHIDKSIRKSVYAYDANGRRIASSDAYYNESSQTYTITFKREMAFDASGIASSTKYYEYDFATSQFLMNQGDSTGITNDPSGRLSSLTNLLYNKTTGQWDNSQKTDFSYNGSSAEPAAHTSYVWNTTTMAWEAAFKKEGQYWPLGFARDQSKASTGWNYSFDGTVWQPVSYDTLITSNNRIDSMYSYRWDGSTLTPSLRSGIVYDAKGAVFSGVTDEYLNNAWEIGGGYKDSLVYAPTGEVLFRHIKNYEKPTAAWMENARIIYFYSGTLSVKDLAVMESIQVYPNPATDKLTVENNLDEQVSATVFSLQGKEVLQVVLEKGSNSLITSQWPAGIYLLRLHHAAAVSARKIVIR